MTPEQARHRGDHRPWRLPENLKNLDLELPHGELIVVTGVSGRKILPGPSTTLLMPKASAGIPNLSPYARQFLDRWISTRPRHRGIPPAIAIDQVQSGAHLTQRRDHDRDNDHLKLL